MSKNWVRKEFSIRVQTKIFHTFLSLCLYLTPLNIWVLKSIYNLRLSPTHYSGTKEPEKPGVVPEDISAFYSKIDAEVHYLYNCYNAKFNFFCCLYSLRIMQPFLFRHDILSFASLSAVPHVSFIFLKSPSKFNVTSANILENIPFILIVISYENQENSLSFLFPKVLTPSIPKIFVTNLAKQQQKFNNWVII